MLKFYVIGLVGITAICLIFSILGFLGKDMMLDPIYTRASKEEQEKLDKKAFRLQGATIFLFLSVLSFCNFLRILLRRAWLGYITLAVLILLVVYSLVSHRILQKNSKS